MSWQLVISSFLIALVDSLNPSAIVITLALLSTSRPVARTLSYIFGIFTTYFTLGVLIYFGLASFLGSVLSQVPQISPICGSLLELLLGLIVVYFGLMYKRSPNNDREKSSKQPQLNLSIPFNTFLLGISVTAVEFSTAAPYIASISLMAKSNINQLESLLILFVYNLIFVLPPVVLVIVYIKLGHQAQPLLNKINSFISKASFYAIKYALIVFGLFLVVDSLAYLAQN